MASLDALRHVTIGQFFPGVSAIHRLDPRAKIVGLGLLGVAIVVAGGYTTSALLVALLYGLVVVARLPLRVVLANLLPAAPLIALFALLQLVFYGRGPAGAASRDLLAWGRLVISTAGVQLVIVSLLRFLSLLFLTALLTNTTTVGALTRGVESLLRPLTRVGLPGHEVAMIAAIALRFLPILGEQMQTIAQAQALRGVDAGATSRWQMARNARRLAALIVPLFVDAYRRSEEMTDAMLARCYQGGRGRTHLVTLRLAWGDYAFLGAALVVLVVTVLLQRTPLP